MAPTLAQVQALGNTLRVSAPQVLLLLPLFTCAAATVALPPASRATLTLRARAVTAHTVKATPLLVPPDVVIVTLPLVAPVGTVVVVVIFCSVSALNSRNSW